MHSRKQNRNENETNSSSLKKPYLIQFYNILVCITKILQEIWVLRYWSIPSMGAASASSQADIQRSTYQRTSLKTGRIWFMFRIIGSQDNSCWKRLSLPKEGLGVFFKICSQLRDCLLWDLQPFKDWPQVPPLTRNWGTRQFSSGTGHAAGSSDCFHLWNSGKLRGSLRSLISLMALKSWILTWNLAAKKWGSLCEKQQYNYQRNFSLVF